MGKRKTSIEIVPVEQQQVEAAGITEADGFLLDNFSAMVALLGDMTALAAKHRDNANIVDAVKRATATVMGQRGTLIGLGLLDGDIPADEPSDDNPIIILEEVAADEPSEDDTLPEFTSEPIEDGDEYLNPLDDATFDPIVEADPAD